MNFARLLEILGEEPVFESGLLLAGEVDPVHVRRQLSRWRKAGKILQLRRGLYAPAPPYRKVKPHPFHLANRMVRASYVSLQSALAHYGLIPEYVPVTTSVTTQGPGRWKTDLGLFDYRHLKVDHLHGYRAEEMGGGQSALVAGPEKALLDLVYLEPHADRREYLRQLRLQNLDRLDLAALARCADRFARPKIRRAAERITVMALEEAGGLESLAP